MWWAKGATPGCLCGQVSAPLSAILRMITSVAVRKATIVGKVAPHITR